MICLSDVLVEGQVCYSPKEIEFLKIAEKSMEPGEYSNYLKKIHLAKKIFPESKIEDVKMEARQEEIAVNSTSEISELRVEDAEQPVASTIPEQKSFWEL